MSDPIASDLGAAPCHRCGIVPQFDGRGYLGWALYCTDCYDGENGEAVDTMTPEQSIREWNEIQEDKREGKPIDIMQMHDATIARLRAWVEGSP